MGEADSAVELRIAD
jgi:hypothetical protein